MSFVRINSTTEYDPVTRTIRQDGQTRPAGLAALGFSTLLEVQQQIKGEAPDTQAAPQAEPPPALPPQRVLSANGAPLITLSAEPAPNPWNYAGPGARNPYFVTSGAPLENGLIPGYENWFQTSRVLQASATGGSTETAYTMRVVTEEGAREALRLVQEYVAEATLEATVFGAGGGPWRADTPSYHVVLPGGSHLNAAAILDSYYNQGRGVTSLSDFMLRDELRFQTSRGSLG